MSKDKSQFTPKQVETESKSVLEDIFGKGARRCLAAALEAKVNEFMNSMSSKRDENSHCLAVRNGTHIERPIMTGMGGNNNMKRCWFHNTAIILYKRPEHLKQRQENDSSCVLG